MLYFVSIGLHLLLECICEDFNFSFSYYSQRPNKFRRTHNKVDYNTGHENNGVQKSAIVNYFFSISNANHILIIYLKPIL